MKLKELNKLISYEEKCEKYLQNVGILKLFTSCIGCGATSLGMIRGERYRCYSCKKEWSRRKGSILSLTRFSYSEFLICLKYFALESSAELVSEEYELNYKTVRMLFNYFRMKITDIDEKALEGFIGLIKGDTDLLGLNVVEGKITFEFSPKKDDEARIKAVRHRVQNGATYFEFSYEKLRDNIKEGKSEDYIGELERFWRFAGERLFGYKGTEQKYFILFLKELEFRYNHRNEDIFDAIVAKLS